MLRLWAVCVENGLLCRVVCKYKMQFIGKCKQREGLNRQGWPGGYNRKGRETSGHHS